ncbi:UDP-glucuronic acid decarboxylase family protein [Streptomyces sp. YS415]|uniref:UDP-glucuronic acid decarboxylase family protein n=1 Tax=Streptomyces sp. YS415 TaxID=2944806 RepID=UPI0020211DBC|nr:UDP-glucuronic acid decarboxylase family protein [Streptomyces sp. YS415]MCL7427196.1 SDR family oxidoreductase [Streptomyces sp. YS415]
MRVVVTGGGGFLGSHLCEALLRRGDAVVCLDDFSTGVMENVTHLLSDPAFELQRVDVSEGIDVAGRVDAVAHLASPASPPDYLRRPLETLAVGSRGTENALRLALRHGARFVLASTSEIYGDPLVHPQEETYWGNVNSIGPRSVYDEAKRFAEAVSAAYRRTHGLDVGIARIFNTYGPRMRPHDGRVVSSFITQALTGEPITIYGDGGQTRSFCYVDDLTRGLLALLDSSEMGPFNLGNPIERTVCELAETVLTLTGSASEVNHHPLPVDDPVRRRPVITRARQVLGWTPEIDLADGLRRTIAYFSAHPDRLGVAAAAIRGGQDETTVLPASVSVAPQAIPAPAAVSTPSATASEPAAANG